MLTALPPLPRKQQAVEVQFPAYESPRGNSQLQAVILPVYLHYENTPGSLVRAVEGSSIRTGRGGLYVKHDAEGGAR